ncbi:MAG: hypothetical protein WD278_16765 [Pirellulales bacterium]
MKTNTSTPFRWPLALCAFASVMLLGSRLPAQDASNGGYDEIRVLEGPGGQKIDIAEPRGARSALFRLATTGRVDNADDQKLFDDYFRFRVAELTWKENLASLTDKRSDLKRLLSRLGQASAPDLHTQLNALLLSEMPKIALDDGYHPAARANCMLIVADLNRQEPRPGGAGAVPLPEALPVLLDAVQDTDQHDVVRVTALRGIVRHAESNMAQNVRKGVVDAMLQLVTAKEPAENKSKDGNLWLCMMAADVLGTLAAQGPEANLPEVCQALAGLVAQADGEIWVRCQAAESLGALEPKSFPANGVGKIAADLASLVVDISKANAQTAAEVDTAAAPPKLREILAAELVDQLTQVKSALVGRGEPPAANRGLRAAADNDAARQLIDGLVTKIDEIVVISGDTKLSLTDLAKSVQDKGLELETWLKTQTGKATADPVAVGASVRPKPDTTPVNLSR